MLQAILYLRSDSLYVYLYYMTIYTHKVRVSRGIGAYKRQEPSKAILATSE
jgi:hypothetical protein